MARLYLRRRKRRSGETYYKVYIRYTDSWGVSRRRSTPFTIDSPRTKDGTVIFPRHIIEFKDKLEARVTLDNFGLSPKRVVRIKLSKVYEEFLERRATDRARRTKYLYKLAVNKFIELFGDVYIHEITTETLHEYKTYWIKRDGKINTSTYIRSISPLFTYAADKDYIVKSPVNSDVRIKIDYEEPEVYTVEQIRIIFTCCLNGYTDSAGKTVDPDSALRDQLRFLLLTGFRSDESCQLLWRHVDFDNKTVFHINAKSKRDEHFPMDGVLEDHLKNTGKKYAPYVFKYRSYSTIGRKLRRINNSLGYSHRLDVHALKATYATWIQEAGIKPASSEFLTHHKDWKTTLKHYTKLRMDMLREELSKARKDV